MIQSSLVLVASLVQGPMESHAAAAVPENLRWLWLIPILPAIGFVFQVFIGTRHLPKPVVSFISCGVVLVSAALSWFAFSEVRKSGHPIEGSLGAWIHIMGTNGLPSGVMAVIVNHRLVVDQLTCVMILVVTNIAFLIHVYSIGYMAEEKRYARFFAYLNLFTAFMLVLVMASSLILMFVGWEGVGLCSYLLIGFWYEKKENAIAGMKAFIVNRIGDLAFTIGVLTLFVTIGVKTGTWTVDFDGIKNAIHDHPNALSGTATFIGIMMFIGATGKSAQLPLYTWLPDAMAGPTPVSALIHAATMVTAGVYMIARMNFLYVLTPTAMTVVATVGAITALFAGSIGIAQNDIKKVLAYSTVSQLGFMFMGVGVGAYAAGVFHLFTHAFFKACLFLGSGSVIHGMGHEQDIRKMGGLKSKMRVTWITFGLSTLAIAGIFPFAGFFSKDEILWKTFNAHELLLPGWILWAVGVLAALFTAFYMTRLVIKTFYGRAMWAQASSFSGGGVDLPDWMDEDDEKKKEHDAHSRDESSPAHDLPTDESVLDLGKVGKHDEHAAADAHSPHDAHDAGHGHGQPGEPHESPTSMLVALVVLAAGSCLVGLLGMPHWFPGGDQFGHWLEPVFGGHATGHAPAHEESHGTEIGFMILSTVVALSGIGAAVYVYGKRNGVPAKDFAEKHHDLYDLVLNKYRVDELYDATVVQPLLNLNEVAGRFDNEVVDGSVNGVARCGSTMSRGTGYFDNEVVDAAVNAAANATQAAGQKIRRLQTGNIKDYLTFALVGGLFVIAAFCLFLTWPDLVHRLSAIFGG
jgi:NADH-quinone oxidoreductase subunit L